MATTSFLTRIAGTLMLMAMAGCTSVAPRSEIPGATDRYLVGVQPSPAAAAAGVAQGTSKRTWWEDFADPSLNALIELALHNNHDLKAALAAVDEARAMAGAAKREALPTGGLEAKAEQSQLSAIEADPYRQGFPRPPSHRLLNVGQFLSWEIDLFGRIGTATAVAERQADAAQADVHAAATLLQGEVARHYFEMRRNQQALRSLETEVDLLERRAAKMNARYEAGLVDRRAMLAATGDHAHRAAEKAQTAAALHAEVAALAVLVGRSPAASDGNWEALIAPAPLPDAPDLTTLTQPTDLLARRPDVARADALLRASLGNVVLAERAHLPRLSLNLFGGVLGPFGTTGDSSAQRYSARPSLQWEWLDFGRRNAREAAARAGSEAAWHKFEQTVLTALRESETSLRDWSGSRSAWEEAQRSESVARRATDYASTRVAAGLEPPTMDLEQQAAYEQVHREAIAAQAKLLQAHVQVQLALGAWQPDDESATAQGHPGNRSHQ
ncbi:TPA: TolC family protein [Pseudomonas aeruginosa]